MVELGRFAPEGIAAFGGGGGGSVADETFYDALVRKGMCRRSFLKFCAGVAGMFGMAASGVEAIAQALEAKKKIPVVWLEFQDCAGNTEAFLRAAKPAIDEIILDAISLDYHETLMSAAGHQAEASLAKTVKDWKGKYIAIIEGSIPMADGGVYCTIGGRTALDIAREVCGGALVTLAAGTCASFGGLPAAKPNPTGAVSVKAAVPGANVINLSACPFNPANVTATIVHYLTFSRWPELDSNGRPLFAYGTRIHDNCERRAHFDAGRFAHEFGDEGHRHGHCLYELGCKGPIGFQNCPTVRWNEGMSWPVAAGHPCIACAAPNFWDEATPFYERLPGITGGLDMKVDQIGIAAVATTAAVMTVHGIAKAVQRSQLRKLPMVGDTTAAPPADGRGS